MTIIKCLRYFFFNTILNRRKIIYCNYRGLLIYNWHNQKELDVDLDLNDLIHLCTCQCKYIPEHLILEHDEFSELIDT